MSADRAGMATRRWWVLAVVCMAMFMGVLDSTSVYAALPAIARSPARAEGPDVAAEYAPDGA